MPPLRALYCSFCSSRCGLSLYARLPALQRYRTKSSLLHRQAQRPFAHRSSQAQRKEQADGGEIRNDVGLFPGGYIHLLHKRANAEHCVGTFIMPTGSRKPSLFLKPRRRLLLEWYRLKKKFEAFKMQVFHLPDKRKHIVPKCLKSDEKFLQDPFLQICRERSFGQAIPQASTSKNCTVSAGQTQANVYCFC